MTSLTWCLAVTRIIKSCMFCRRLIHQKLHLRPCCLTKAYSFQPTFHSHHNQPLYRNMSSSALNVNGPVASTSKLPFEVPEIKLDTQEKSVLDLIDAFTGHLEKSRPDLPKVVCRVAGGWVRDKLLGMECDDLDICISSLTGVHFATLLEEYLEQQRSLLSTDSSNQEKDLLKSTRIAVIHANPEQSKHLETAHMAVLGLELDLVQLRSEEYASEDTSNRIPTAVKFGTPLEDALRRDITINALFYNIHSRTVEDFTGKGLPDLLSSTPLIRTPLEPLQTFLDDPLRILRCIRFASRFNFPLSPDIVPAVLEPRVRNAFKTKVSKERVGVELGKMLKGRDPLLSLQLIDEFRFYDLIFGPVESLNITPSTTFPGNASKDALRACQALLDLQTKAKHGGNRPISTLLSILDDSAARARFWLALFLLPLREITYMEKKKVCPLTDTAVRDSVKLPTSDRIYVQRIHTASDKLRKPSKDRFLAQGAEKERSSNGLLLRDPDVHDPISGLDWRASVLFACVREVTDASADANAGNLIFGTYSAFVQRILELQLDTQAFEKTRLDGKEVASVLGVKPGKQVAVLLQAVLEWQLDHPEASKDDGAAWLKTRWDAGDFST